MRRAGHTEATTDLARLAGRRPVGALIEICSQHGHGMADYAELQKIAEQYSMPMISIEELIRYRRSREQLVTRAVSVEIPTGEFGRPTVVGYQVAHESQEPLA
ncbi:MAG: 3,4-dihydroxy-2-butanone-4-phosphate synthase, partial [Phycisphaerae bacterium]